MFFFPFFSTCVLVCYSFTYFLQGYVIFLEFLLKSSDIDLPMQLISELHSLTSWPYPIHGNFSYGPLLVEYSHRRLLLCVPPRQLCVHLPQEFHSVHIPGTGNRKLHIQFQHTFFQSVVSHTFYVVMNKHEYIFYSSVYALSMHSVLKH